MHSNPLALIAEITHRCPLHCVYCSNPLQLSDWSRELPSADWVRVFCEAADLGVLHLHLTGGEPLARPDLAELVSAAHAAGLYTNLITSGIGLSERRLAQLVDEGLDHIQLSFQNSRAEAADWIAGAKAHAHKIELARFIRKQRVAFTVNLVVHRQNLDHLEESIAFIEGLSPDRIEIAHVQYYGWALRNRAALMPTRAQVDNAVKIVALAQERLAGRVRIDSVLPDYYALYPKPCMGGWGRRLLLIDPEGRALPCHAAGVIPNLTFDNVREHELRWLWEESPAFQRYRGEDWMPEPCRSCDRRSEDFGGCRCQALLLTGEASATDPACSKSPLHHVVQEAVFEGDSNPAQPAKPSGFISLRQLRETNEALWAYRTDAG
jgi:pyrroloquinoline quinone biosynthesis protein E